MRDEIITPETHPDHKIVGRYFRSHCIYDQRPAKYYCDSFDPNLGFWMTRVDAPQENRQDQTGKWRRNVSGRAINSTYHLIFDLDGKLHSLWGPESKYVDGAMSLDDLATAQ